MVLGGDMGVVGWVSVGACWMENVRKDTGVVGWALVGE